MIDLNQEKLTQLCRNCCVVKSLDDFLKNPDGMYGVKTICKECNSKLDKIRYEAKKAERIKQIRAWQATHKNRHRLYNRLYEMRVEAKKRAAKKI